MLGVLLRGMAVGVTETIPGISGSTVAMVLGIYERLIHSLSLLTTERRKEALPFLFKFGVGMVIGFAVTIFAITFFLEHHRTPTLLFFMGIIVGFLPYLWKDTVEQSENNLKARHYVIMVLFLVVVVFGQSLNGFVEFDLNNLSITDYVFFALAGFVASIALVLPGISGALVLTILGLYEVATNALKTLDLPIVFAISTGIIAGVLLTSRFIRYLLASHAAETYAAMVGLVTGSIYAILSNIGNTLNAMTIALSIFTFIVGIAFIVTLKKIQKP